VTYFVSASHKDGDLQPLRDLKSSNMFLNDSVMARGAALHAAIAERFLADGFEQV
jgi:hypothetical protein